MKAQANGTLYEKNKEGMPSLFESKYIRITIPEQN